MGMGSRPASKEGREDGRKKAERAAPRFTVYRRGLETWMNVLSELNMRWKDDHVHMCITNALCKNAFATVWEKMPP